MTDPEAQARAVALMGAGAVAANRGEHCEPGSRYLVGAPEWWNRRESLQGCGATWEQAFAAMWISPIVAALSGYSFMAHDERTLYPELETALTGARSTTGALTSEALRYEREHVLSPKSRVDFFFPETGVAMEVKVQGTPAAILRQLTRYAECETVHALLLVTTMGKLTRVPTTIAGKPVRALRVAGGFG